MPHMDRLSKINLKNQRFINIFNLYLYLNFKYNNNKIFNKIYNIINIK